MRYSNLKEEVQGILAEARVNFCTETAFNRGKEYAINVFEKENPNLVDISYALICINANIIQDYAVRNTNSYIKNYKLTNAQYQNIYNVCSKLSGVGKAVGFGVGGSILGGHLFGTLGLIVGGVLGALAGNEYNKNDKEKFYKVLTEALNIFYQYLYDNNAIRIACVNPNANQQKVITLSTSVKNPSKATSQMELNKSIGLNGLKQESLKMKDILHNSRNEPNEINEIQKYMENHLRTQEK